MCGRPSEHARTSERRMCGDRSNTCERENSAAPATDGVAPDDDGSDSAAPHSRAHAAGTHRECTAGLDVHRKWNTARASTETSSSRPEEVENTVAGGWDDSGEPSSERDTTPLARSEEALSPSIAKAEHSEQSATTTAAAARTEYEHIDNAEPYPRCEQLPRAGAVNGARAKGKSEPRTGDGRTSSERDVQQPSASAAAESSEHERGAGPL